MTDVPSLAFQQGEAIRFIGAKVTLFVGTRIVTVLRDDIPSIPWPGYWDLPGGGREGEESPFDCVARETMEEVNLSLGQEDVVWAKSYFGDGHDRWFFVARMDEQRAADMQLGNEGQRIILMTPDDYLIHPKAIPAFQSRMADWIAGF